ncbi:hypothetical protein ISU10_15020 [Nocardioides agariphilus]|jgi:hypothetical protein|uniref:Allene oxide cyclase barrel-like domain-containing protein n=1 Tax=Nocardioides agariphilus TaxID=433664 RepID=A0A930YJA8_9ACTN|nr:hypothetical protein [Nocardioides agariphilus]MBF4769077.1 hypothetical protein [Nocardioides agariphilus]
MHARLLRAGAVAVATGALVTAGLVAPAHAGPGNGHAYGHLKSQCRGFHATGAGTDNGDGTTSATLYQGGREVGSSAGALVPGVPDADGLLPFTGTIVLTTAKKGALEVSVQGTFSTVTGEFSARSVEVDGRGPMRNATGRLRVWGVQDLATGAFTETVHAKVCVPKKHQS